METVAQDQETREGGVIVCPYCSHTNDPRSTRCGQCWSRLRGALVVSEDEATSIVDRLLSVRRWRKRIRYGVAAAIVLFVVAWIAFLNIGTTRFQGPASTNVSAASTPGNWPMFQRDHLHSGLVADDHAVPSGRLKWRFDTDGPLFSSPAVVDGKVYLTTGDRRVVALDEATGDLIWERKTTGPVNSSPAVAGGILYYGLRDGNFFAVDSYSGEELWKYKTDNYIFSSPAVHKGVVYIGSGDSLLYAFDAQTGDLRWTYDAKGPILTPPAVNDEVVTLVSQSGTLHVVDTNTGNLRLDYSMVSISNGSPTMLGNLVYSADEAGGIRAVDWRKRVLPFEKSARWLRAQLFIWGMINSIPPQKGYVWADRIRGGGFSSTPVIANGALYIGSHGEELLAFDAETGEPLWEFPTDAPVLASASVAGDTVYVGDSDGILYAVDGESGKLAWRFATGARIDSTPVIASGVLFLTSRDGTLYAIE